MKPTLFLDDINISWVIDTVKDVNPEARAASLMALERILPKRCPCPEVDPDMNSCDGLGWLYPDMPEWWQREAQVMDDTMDTSSGAIKLWHWFCEDVWRAMGIVE